MAKSRSEKESIVKRYEELINNSKAIYFANADLSVNETTDLKKKLYESQGYLTVVKNTLFKIALKNSLQKDIPMEGKNTGVFCYDDVVSPAKFLKDLKKEEKLEYVMCFIEGEQLEPEKIDSLAQLETKEELLSKTVYLFNYPLTSFARSLNNNIEKLCYALNALKDSKES
jgi:large subunit ribosomal protein L10